MRRLVGLASVLALIGVLVVGPGAPAGAVSLPLGYSTGNATQVITVVAKHGATYGYVQRWTKYATAPGWKKYGPAMFAYVGAAGVTTSPRENYPGTPAGSFTMTNTFGRMPRPATKMGYFKTDAKDWWAGDSRSAATYNTHQRCNPADCRFSTAASERLYYVGTPYNYAVVIDYNRFPKPVPGKGSGFFLHVANGQPTAGCVSVSQSNMLAVLGWLDPAKHPRILIGFG